LGLWDLEALPGFGPTRGAIDGAAVVVVVVVVVVVDDDDVSFLFVDALPAVHLDVLPLAFNRCSKVNVRVFLVASFAPK